MNHHTRVVLKIVLGVWMGFAADNLSPAFQQDCTLKPMDGNKRRVLSGGVNGRMTWSACTSIIQDFVFEWPHKQSPRYASGGAEASCFIAQRMEKSHQDGVQPIRRSCHSHRQTSGAGKPLRLWRAVRSDGYPRMGWRMGFPEHHSSRSAAHHSLLG